MKVRQSYLVIAFALLTAACTQQPPTSSKSESAEPPAAAVETTHAVLIGSDKSWGNTEGAAIDSKNNFYFCSRGTYKGIVMWNEKDGAKPWLAVATEEGPGGLWIDDADNIYLTATGERQIQKVTPDKKLSVVAQNFEADPKLPKGPNDLVVAKNGTVYFTDPNGFYGDAPNGTVYWISGGKTAVFSDAVTGPNGIIVSQDEKTLYVSHNSAKSTSKIVRWPLKDDGSAGPMSEIVTIPDCRRGRDRAGSGRILMADLLFLRDRLSRQPEWKNSAEDHDGPNGAHQLQVRPRTGQPLAVSDQLGYGALDWVCVSG